MALPTLARTWRFHVNNVVTAQGTVLTTARRLMRLIVTNAYLGGGSWTDSAGAAVPGPSLTTVVGSSNGTTAALDGVYRWVADTDLVWAAAGTAHSWIVLEFTGMAQNFQLCIDLSNVTASSATVVVSWNAGFTGGTTLARPTATDEFVFIANTSWGMSASDRDQRYHVLRSTDGRDVRVFITRNGNTTAFWFFCVPGNVIDAAWTNPTLVTTVSVSTDVPGGPVNDFAAWFGANTIGARAPTGAMTGMFTCEGVRVATVLLAERQTVVNAFNGDRPFFPVGWFSNTAGLIGRHASLVDCWAAEAIPRMYPADLSKQFIQIGSTVHPWNGSAPNFGAAGSPAEVDAYLVEPAVAPLFLMEAWDSVTTVQFNWIVTETPDFGGVGYPGPNSPTDIAIAGILRS